MSNGYGRRPGMGSGMAERGARAIEDRATKRMGRTAAALAAAREARGYKPGEGKKMAERLRKKAR